MACADSWVPGYRFKDGRLLVFERERLTLVRPWPEPDAARKAAGRGWQKLCPEFRLVRPYRRRRKQAPSARQKLLPLGPMPVAAPSRSELAEQKRRAFDALRFALPRELARAVERFQGDQFPLLRMASAAAGFVDLLGGNPALAFQLADRFARGPVPPAAAALVSAKQTEVLGALGLPAAPAVVKILRKVEPESVSREHARALRAVLAHDDARQQLAHLPRINAGVTQILGDERLRAAVAPALLQEVALDRRERYRAEVAKVLLDALTLHADLRVGLSVPRFNSVERLRAAVHELSEEYARTRQSGILSCRFPQAPVRGTADIVPLRQPRELISEGLQQHNCVASYAPAVARGDTFIYRVLAPERATLAVRRGPGGCWYASELLAACNTAVRTATERAVGRWLDAHTVSA